MPPQSIYVHSYSTKMWPLYIPHLWPEWKHRISRHTQLWSLTRYTQNGDHKSIKMITCESPEFQINTGPLTACTYNYLFHFWIQSAQLRMSNKACPPHPPMATSCPTLQWPQNLYKKVHGHCNYASVDGSEQAVASSSCLHEPILCNQSCLLLDSDAST